MCTYACQDANLDLPATLVPFIIITLLPCHNEQYNAFLAIHASSTLMPFASLQHHIQILNRQLKTIILLSRLILQVETTVSKHCIHTAAHTVRQTT